MSFEMEYDVNGTPQPRKEKMNEFDAQSQAQQVSQQQAIQAIEDPETQEDSYVQDLQERLAPEIEEEVTESPKENNLSQNMRALREKSERVERERNEAVRRLQEMEARFQQPPKQQEPEEDYNLNLAPDDIAEGKHLSKVDKRIRALEAEVKRYQQQSAQNAVEMRIKNQFPDFDNVVTADNVQQLRENYPELAKVLNSSSDVEAVAASAYRMIKQFGIHKQPAPQQSSDQLRAKANSVKPRTLTSVSPQQGDSPLSRANAFANGLTPELAAQLRKEMDDASRNM